MDRGPNQMLLLLANNEAVKIRPVDAVDRAVSDDEPNLAQDFE
ncbi:MAG TPA: hypothetical protein VIR57_07605 [Chloroflexota bacterium]|jgi:hypothetical protein